MKTLIIIDIQDNFLEYSDPIKVKEIKELKLNIIDLIKVYMVNDWPIILVEYSGNYKTCKEISDIIDKYHKLYLVTKNQCDGSEKIMDVIHDYNLPRSLNICGVYSDECVFRTKRGLEDYDGIEFVIYRDCVWPFVKENEIYEKKRECVLKLRKEQNVSNI